MVAKYYGNALYHSGVAGMKWGYADGSRVAGKRTAQSALDDAVKKKDYNAVQNQVNELAKAGHTPEQIQAMLHQSMGVGSSGSGNSKLDVAVKNKDYAAVQEEVNRLAKEGKSPEEIEKMLHQSMGKKDSKSKKKSNDDIANDVIRGKYGNGKERRAALEKAGYKYEDVQKIVNEKMKKSKSSSKKSDKKDDKDKKSEEEKKKRAVYKGGSANKNLMKSEAEKSKDDNRYAIRSRLKNGL